MDQQKEQNKSLETDLKVMDIYELPDKEFEVTIMIMFSKLMKTMHGEK